MGLFYRQTQAAQGAMQFFLQFKILISMYFLHDSDNQIEVCEVKSGQRGPYCATKFTSFIKAPTFS